MTNPEATLARMQADLKAIGHMLTDLLRDPKFCDEPPKFRWFDETDFFMAGWWVRRNRN